MSEALLLLKTQLYNYFSLNELFHPQQKNRAPLQSQPSALLPCWLSLAATML